MKRLILITILLLLTASCSRKVTQTATETSSSAAISKETAKTEEHADLHRLNELLTLTLSTRAEVTDSVHIHTHTLTTLDAEGNVIGSTREETSDRWRRSASSSAMDKAGERLRNDSTANRNTALASGHAEAVRSEQTRTEAVVKAVPWWERVIGDFLGSALVAATIVAAGVGVAAAVRRWRRLHP